MVVKHLQSGAYLLAEVNGAVLYLKFAAFQLIPYYPYSRKYFEIMEFMDKKDIDRKEKEKTIEDMTRTLYLEKKGEVWG